MGQHPILTVENLKVIVSTPYGVTQAVNDVSFLTRGWESVGHCRRKWIRENDDMHVFAKSFT